MISIAGIPLGVLADSLTFHDAEGDSDVQKLMSVFQEMHGHIPPYFYSNGIHKLATPIIEGNYTEQCSLHLITISFIIIIV